MSHFTGDSYTGVRGIVADLTVLNALPRTVPMHDEFFLTMLGSFEIEPPTVLERYIVFIDDGVAVGICFVRNDRPELLVLHIDLALVTDLLGPGIEEERGAWLDRKPFSIQGVTSLFISTALELGSTLDHPIRLRVIRIS